MIQSENIRSRGKLPRFSPLANMNSDRVTRLIDAFEAGHLRGAVILWDQLEQRDDMIRAVVSKRKKSVARHGWVIETDEGCSDERREEARSHADALAHFYRNLRCEHAVESSEQGGFKLLARQMMDAVGKRFAVHEIVWNTAGAGDTQRPFVSANFRFVPLNFFENTTGELKFLPDEGSTAGVSLTPGGWLITVGEGLMAATSLAWAVKNLSLNDWLGFSEHNGRPALRGITSAARDSEEWRALDAALEQVIDGKSIVHSTSDDVKVIDLGAGGSIPFPRLVERMDRMIAALWRGADLSTLSRDRGYGASLQEKETCALEEDDAELLTETLNRQVDPWVIRHVFGEGVAPLARVKVLVAPRECTAADLQIDEFLLKHGAPLSIEAALHRYGRTLPKPHETIFITRSNPASHSESSQNSGTAGVHHAMQNDGHGTGPSVSSRGGSPGLDATAGGAEEVQAALPNQFTPLQGEWLQLSPYGDFPHARGVQRVDRAAADAMVQNFNSFLSRAGRLFGGVPFYVGHPDLPGAHELADRRAYGWVTEVAARDDGFYGRIKWSDAGRDLLKNAHYKFLSPYWEAREIGRENGQRIFRPAALVSVGFTNSPNIPVKPLANEAANASPVPSEPLANRSAAPAAIPSASLTRHLGRRKAEMIRLENRVGRIQERVLEKMQLGLSYDHAWESVKRYHRNLFEEI